VIEKIISDENSQSGQGSTAGRQVFEEQRCSKDAVPADRHHAAIPISNCATAGMERLK
jgi:hypothetical protein